MPLFFQQQTAEAQVAVWHITEGEDFFVPYLPPLLQVTHPHKRLQHYAGRFLLQHVEPRFPLAQILLADTRKPYLPNEAFHFSISHCGDFAAVCISEKRRVGVDIEAITPKIARIQNKFCSEAEAALLAQHFATSDEKAWHQALTLLWSTKEALFKWYSMGGVDFIGHMPLRGLQQKAPHQFESTVHFQKEAAQIVQVYNRFLDGLCLSFVVT